MPLHISRVEVENFRNFNRMVIDPFPSTALVVGENNVGKTNLLYAMRILLDPDLPDSARDLRSEDFYDGGPGIAGGSPVRIVLELTGFDDDDQALGVLKSCLVAGEPARARIEYVFEPREPLDEEPVTLTAADYDWRLLGGAPDDLTELRREPRRFIALKVLPALRDAGEELTGKRSPLRELLERVTPAANVLDDAAGKVNAAMDALVADEAVGGLQDAIRIQTTDMIGPAVNVSPTLGFAPAVPDQLLRQVRVFVDAERRRGLSGTGVGVANMLYLALLLERVRQRRASGEHVSTILGVEEPEAHLHVHMQRRLFGFLLRSEPALTLTSHSPHIAAVAPLGSLVLLRATPHGTVATTTHRAGLSPQQRADMERYLDATRAEVLFARYALLVEGDGERYVVPALARAAGFDLDAYGVSVIPVQGTDFVPFRRLLGKSGLDISHLIVTDGDRAELPYPVTTVGLLRSVALCAEPPSEELRSLLPQHPGRDGHSAITAAQDVQLREHCARHDIFLGDTTLEIDLAKLFPNAFCKAVDDLFSPTVATEQKSLIDKLVGGQDDPEVRRVFVGRIEAKGKGRFAQRLAEHLTSEPRSTIEAALADSRPEGYLLRGLDQASRVVRSMPLLDTEPGEPRGTQ